MDDCVMDINIIELRELKPRKDMSLTNGEVFVAPNDSVFLGVNDSPDNWYEITSDEYYTHIKEEREKEELI